MQDLVHQQYCLEALGDLTGLSPEHDTGVGFRLQGLTCIAMWV